MDEKLCTEEHKYVMEKEMQMNEIFHHHHSDKYNVTQIVSICVSKM